MKPGRFTTVVVCLMLCIALSAVACAPVPPVTQAPFNLQATLIAYFSNLPENWGAITPAELNAQITSTKPFLVDVREVNEVASAGFIAGAINIPIRTLIKNLDKLPAKDQPIVVTCGSGHRSALAMEALQLLGYARVQSLAGGLGAWKAANLPVASGTPPEPKAGSAPVVDKNLVDVLDRYLGNLPDGWNTIAPATLNDLLKTSKPFQIDVRDAKEVAGTGSIQGATNIPLRTLGQSLGQLPPDKGAIVIAECSNGHRSAMTMMTLNLLGYTSVKSLAGGVAAWAAAGLPLSKSQ